MEAYNFQVRPIRRDCTIIRESFVKLVYAVLVCFDAGDSTVLTVPSILQFSFFSIFLPLSFFNKEIWEIGVGL